MIKNTYFKVMNEFDDIFATTGTRREAKTIAKRIAIENKEQIWVIDVLNDNEIAVYDKTGKEI